MVESRFPSKIISISTRDQLFMMLVGVPFSPVGCCVPFFKSIIVGNIKKGKKRCWERKRKMKPTFIPLKGKDNFPNAGSLSSLFFLLGQSAPLSRPCWSRCPRIVSRARSGGSTDLPSSSRSIRINVEEKGSWTTFSKHYKPEASFFSDLNSIYRRSVSLTCFFVRIQFFRGRKLKTTLVIKQDS